MCVSTCLSGMATMATHFIIFQHDNRKTNKVYTYISMESCVHYRLYTLLERVYLLWFLWNNLCSVVEVPLKTGVRLSHIRHLLGARGYFYVHN